MSATDGRLDVPTSPSSTRSAFRNTSMSGGPNLWTAWRSHTRATARQHSRDTSRTRPPCTVCSPGFEISLYRLSRFDVSANANYYLKRFGKLPA